MPIRAYSAAELQAGHRRLAPLVFITVLLSAAVFSLAEGNFFYLAVAAVAVAVHLMAARRGRELYARRIVLNAGVLLAGGMLAVRFFASREDVLVSLGHFVILILLCKLFERKTRRDYTQILVMTMLLVLAATMMNQQLWFALLEAGYLAMLCWTTMVFTLHRNLALAAGPGEAAPGGGAVAAAAPRGPWPGRALLGRLAVVMAAALATGAVVFLILPRNVGRMGEVIRRIGPRRSAISGFTDTVRLGEARSIYLSDRVVMHVRLSALDATPFEAGEPPYLRGRVFDRYADSRWTKGPPRSRQPRVRVGPGLVRESYRQEVTMIAALLPVGFASYPPVMVVSPDCRSQVGRDLELELEARSPTVRPVRYTAYVLRRPLSDSGRDFLNMATGDSSAPPGAPADAWPRVQALARRWCSDLLAQRGRTDPPRRRDELDLALARRISQNLRKSYNYTLDLQEADSARDGVEDFLFHLKRGHCEYFASAMTLMCQLVGVRARLATGFRPSEYDAAAEHYVVRQRDAHAWTEVYTPTTDWVAMDATPPGSLSPPPRSALAAWWGSATDVWRDVEFYWQDKVIGYDEEARRDLGRRVRARLRAAWAAAGRGWREVLRALGELFTKGRLTAAAGWFLAGVACSAVAAAGMLVFVRRRRRRPGGGRPRGGPPPPPPAFIVQLFELFRRRGLSRQADQTPREWAEEAARDLSLPGDEVGGLIALYYRIRWAGRPATPTELDEAQCRVRRLGEMLSP